MENKFKAYVKEYNKCLPVLTIWQDSVCVDLTEINEEFDREVFLKKKVKLIQCTGLTDINNNKAYEKDIYKNHDNSCVGVLTYDNYGLWASEYKDGKLYNNLPFREIDTRNFEIVGNVLENSDWLK